MERNDLGEHLRQLRKQRGISSTQLGERLGVSHTAVLDWERGRSAMSLDRLVEYVDAVEAELVLQVVPREDPKARALRLFTDVYDTASKAELAALTAMLEVWKAQHDARGDSAPVKVVQ